MENTTYEPSCGTHISHACTEACEIANTNKTTVTFDFSGVTLTANPGDIAPLLIERFEQELKRQHAEYLASPKAAADLAEREERRVVAQAKADRLMESVRSSVSVPNGNLFKDLIIALIPGSDAVDNCNVKFDYEEYRDLLAKVGIVHNDCVDDPEVKAWSSKEKCAKWIIGQTASMLHPGLTEKFGNMWLEKWG